MTTVSAALPPSLRASHLYSPVSRLLIFVNTNLLPMRRWPSLTLTQDTVGGGIPDALQNSVTFPPSAISSFCIGWMDEGTTGTTSRQKQQRQVCFYWWRIWVAWENSWRLTRSPLGPSQNDVLVTSAEIPYWWRFSTHILVVLLISWKELGSASFWLVERKFQPIRSTTKIWVETRHQYGISALVTQTSFCEGSSGDLVNSRLFSQAGMWVERNFPFCVGSHNVTNVFPICKLTIWPNSPTLYN